MNSITLLSPAKINLTLKVLGSRPDGYHEIRTIMQPVDLFDHMEIETTDEGGIELSSTGIDIPSGNDNLAWKAADAFLKASALDSGVKIFIRKSIPPGAGLGGGSGNAAAVLTGLNRITGALSQQKLDSLAPALGADVPFFMRSVTALTEGIGEKITIIKNFPLFYYVILVPNLHISTAEVYRKWDEINKTGEKEGSEAAAEEIINRFRDAERDFPLRNDLEAPAAALHPELRAFKDILASLDAKDVLMTGSGSAVYALFTDEHEALGVYDYLKTSPTFQVFFAKGIKGWHRIV
jgi:4-diphosphocytidyl-2-C-methyl-D-erythritol kinase